MDLDVDLDVEATNGRGVNWRDLISSTTTIRGHLNYLRCVRLKKLNFRSCSMNLKRKTLAEAACWDDNKTKASFRWNSPLGWSSESLSPETSSTEAFSPVVVLQTCQIFLQARSLFWSASATKCYTREINLRASETTGGSKSTTSIVLVAQTRSHVGYFFPSTVNRSKSESNCTWFRRELLFLFFSFLKRDTELTQKIHQSASTDLKRWSLV